VRGNARPVSRPIERNVRRVFFMKKQFCILAHSRKISRFEIDRFEIDRRHRFF
jgi:hypothetical protein